MKKIFEKVKLEGGPKKLDGNIIEVEKGAPYCEVDLGDVTNIYIKVRGPWDIPLYRYMGYRKCDITEETLMEPNYLEDIK